jgi:phosphate transport system permease protein
MIALSFLAVFAIAAMAYLASRQRAIRIGGDRPAILHSRPGQHGLLAALWALMLGWGVLVMGATLWSTFDTAALNNLIADRAPDLNVIQRELVLSDARSIAHGGITSKTDELRMEVSAAVESREVLRIRATVGLALLLSIAAGWAVWRQISVTFRARNKSETFITWILAAAALVAIATTVGIVLSLISETMTFFANLDWRIDKFLFGTNWTPLSGIQDGVIDPDRVGALPLFAGTLLITLIAMLVAVPVGLFAAIYLSDFAGPRLRAVAKPMLEILAGIPTVVYGFFAAITVAPWLRRLGEATGLDIASESALAAGVVMGIMIIPFISSLSDDVINAVPQSLRDGSYGLGATKAETMRQVVLPAALPGIVSAVLLGISRAVGETMIVVMAAGQGANLTANPLEAVTTVTVQIVMLITGDTEATVAAGPAFSLGFTLFCLTLGMNIIAQRVVKKYREQYD